MAKKSNAIQKRVSTEMEEASQPQPDHEEISAAVVQDKLIWL